MKNNLILLFKAVFFLAIALYISFTFDKSLTNLVAKVPFGWVVSSIILRSIVVLAFGRGVQLAFKSLKPKLNGLLFFFIGSVIGFGICFALRPIWANDYGDFSSTTHPEILKDTSGQPLQYVNDYTIVSFFTTNCPHCQSTSKALGLGYSTGNIPNIQAFFPGNIEDTENFLKQNDGSKFTYELIEDHEYFLDVTGGSTPQTFLIDSAGKIIKFWTGENINYTALDYLSSLK